MLRIHTIAPAGKANTCKICTSAYLLQVARDKSFGYFLLLCGRYNSRSDWLIVTELWILLF